MILKQFLYILLADYRKILVSLHTKRAFPKQNKDMKDNEQELFPLVDEEGKVSPEEALLREVREELGIETFTPQPVGMYVFDSKRERELVVPALLLVQISQ